MSIPNLFYGSRSGSRIYRAGQGNTDAGSAFDVLFESADVAPAGEHGECVFVEVWLTVTHRAATTIKVTPILDGTLLTGSAIVMHLPQQAKRRTVQLPRMPLREGQVAGGETWGSFALRGARCALRIETVGGVGEGAFILDAAVLSYEVVRESR